MNGALRALAPALLLGLPALATAGAGVVDHVCARDEGQAMCPIGRVRMCSSAGALAGCLCPPGASAKGSASCSADLSASKPAACVVAQRGLGGVMAASLELGELAAPTLPSIASVDAAVTVARLDAKIATASAEELTRLAAAHEALEGESAAEVATLTGQRRKLAIARRDAAVARVIAVLRELRARFPSDGRIAAETVALARAHLRRRAYGVASPDVDDGAVARRLFEEVVASKAGGRTLRDAAFALAEEAIRAGAWSRAITLESTVLSAARGGLADDPAYVAAAYARTAEAELESASFAAAKVSLIDAVSAGARCEPRGECVSAAAASRAVLPGVFAALGEPARALVPILRLGAMPSTLRARPLWKLSEIFASAAGPACAAAADEARAWAQVVR